MPLLGKFIYAGSFSLANGNNSLLHTLPTTPDWVGYTPISATSLPVALVTRTTTAVVLINPNTGTQGEVFALVAHSTIR